MLSAGALRLGLAATLFERLAAEEDVGIPLKGLYVGFPKLGVPVWGPHSKDYSILGSILGSPDFGKQPFSPR